MKVNKCLPHNIQYIFRRHLYCSHKITQKYQWLAQPRLTAHSFYIHEASTEGPAPAIITILPVGCRLLECHHPSSTLALKASTGRRHLSPFLTSPWPKEVTLSSLKSRGSREIQPNQRNVADPSKQQHGLSLSAHGDG